MSAVLTVTNLRVEFVGDHGSIMAVDDVSFSLRRGETLGLVGESGSGKSTIALAMLGLLPRAGRVRGGTVMLGDESLLGLPVRRLRRIRGHRIAMIFQDPMTSLTPWLSIRSQLVEQIRTHLSLSRHLAVARSTELLAAVGIPDPRDALDRFPSEFSGGQRQRIMIAMALSCDPDFLIADEPTTALDVTIQAQVLALLRRLREERGLGLLLITHDLGVVAGMSDRVGVLRRGMLVEEAATDAIFAAPQHAYTRALLRAVPRLSGPRGTRLLTVDDAEIAS